MSDQLATSIPPSLALWHVFKLDEECEGVPVVQEIQLNRGPFGAFRSGPSQPDLLLNCLSESLEEYGAGEDLIQNVEELSLPESALLPWEQDFLNFACDLYEQDLMPSTSDF